MSGTLASAPVVRRAFSERFEWWMLWLLGLGGGIVFIEPSPYELLIALALCVFLVGGCRLAPGGVVMLALLMLFNLGGAISLVPFLHDSDAVTFIAVSFYLAITSGFYAMIVQERAIIRLEALKWGCICAAVMASTAGILGYFDVAGLSGTFTRFGRASGTFKDPNVLGTFIILPMVFLAQEIIRTGRLRLKTLIPLAIILMALFLAFSRGAWGHAIASLGLMVALTFFLVAGASLRRRIIMLTIGGFVAISAALAAALSIEEVRTMFETRATLSQSYDVGETGRFGRQLRAIPTIFEHPNGYGPLQFGNVWGEDPHNVYINAFASYGWLGGLAYATLIFATLVIGWRTVAMRTPVQDFAIAIWSVLFIQILLGLIIDTDHWRHFYLTLGLIWGLHDLGRRIRSRELHAE